MATLEQIADALRKADAAGNVDDARALAAAYKNMVAQAQPQQLPPDAAPRYDGTDARNDYLDLPIPGTKPAQPAPVQYRSPIPGADVINAFANNFAENIPILGPLTTAAADHVGSNLASQFTGKPAEVLRNEAARVRELESQSQPQAAAAGQIAGAVGPLMSVGTTELGGRALGMAGPLWQRLMAGGLSGGAIAGGDSLARGENWDEAKWKALWGAGIGAASPLAERALAPIVRALFGQRIGKPAANIARNVERDRINPAQIRTLLDALGPDAVLADLGPNLTRQAAAIASLPGEGQSIIRDALVRRQQGTNMRIRSDVDATLGPAPVPSRVRAEIETGQQAMSPEYEEVFRNASAVNTRPLAETFDDMARRYGIGERRRVIDRIRGFLNVTDDNGRVSLTSDPSRVFAMREEIDGMFQGETNDKVIAALTSARQQVDDILASGVPGLKQVDARYEDLGRQNTAVGQGSSVLGVGKEAPVPAEVVDMMSPTPASELFIGPSGVPFRVSQGARAEIERLIGTKANNLTSLKDAMKGDGSWNRERLATVFGQEKADALLNILERETTYAATAQPVLHNSETAARTAAQREVEPMRLGSTQSLIGDALLKLPQAAANAAARARSEAVNSRMAAALAGQPSPEYVDRIIAALVANRGKVGSSAVPLLVNQN